MNLLSHSSLGQKFKRVLLGLNQGESRAALLAGGSGEKSTFKFMQIVGRIELHAARALRSIISLHCLKTFNVSLLLLDKYPNHYIWLTKLCMVWIFLMCSSHLITDLFFQSIFTKFSDLKDMLYLAFIPVHLFLICPKYSSLSHLVIFYLANTHSSFMLQTPQSNPQWCPKSRWMLFYEFM